MSDKPPFSPPVTTDPHQPPETLLRIQHELLLGLHQAHDLSEKLRLCLDAALNAAGMDRGGIYLIDESGGLRLERATESSQDFAQAVHRYPVDTAVARLAMAGMPFYAHHAELETTLSESEQGEALRVLAIVPFRDERRVIGCLKVTSGRVDEVPMPARLALEAVASVVGLLFSRARADEVLRKFSRVIEQTASTVIITGTEGVIEYVNPRFSETTGYSAAEVIGRRPSLLRSGYTSPEEYRQLWHTIKGGDVWHGEFHNRRKDGSLYWEAATISPIRDEQGLITHFVGIKDDITDRKLAEAALKESESLLKQAQRLARIGSWRWDFRTDALIWSQELYRIFGRDPALPPANHTELMQYFTAESRARLSAAVDRTIHDGTPYETDLEMARPDGNRWVLAIGKAVRDRTGAIVELRGMMQDITDRKRAELARAEQEARYRAVIETASDGFWMLDKDGRILAVNEAYVRRSGYSREELLTMWIGDIEAQESPEEVRAHIEKVKRSGSDLFETRHRTRDGEVWPAEVNTSYSSTAGGIFFAFSRDITERKQAEESLRESENRYRNLFMHSPDCILVNHQGHITLVNRTCLRLFGVNSDQALVGKSPYDLFHPDFHPMIAARIRRMCETGEAAPPIEEKILRYDRSTVDVEVIAAPFPVGDGSAIHVILRDITERKALERQIIEVSTAEQERIGHDIHDGIGQQLTGASMLAAGIERRLIAAGHQSAATAIAELRTHLLNTLEEARSLARGLSPVDLDSEGLADALIDLAERITQTSGVKCRYEGLRTVQADNDILLVHLYRIAQEAVHNAVRHGAPGVVEIRLDPGPDGIVLTVRDDGKGFDITQDSYNRLGLRLMRYRAGIIGGRLSIAPAAQGGTLVRCEVPLSP